MDQLKKPPSKKQPEPDSLDQQKQQDPDPEQPQNEEPEKHQTGHQLAAKRRQRAPDEGQQRQRDRSKGRF
ncbi:MAG: hypothetical protein JWN94_4958 [Betaproteobacteria bacterium]|nr:hypothetical protein [Betaproteobacteria bacterium]